MIEMWTTSWQGVRGDIKILRYTEFSTTKPWTSKRKEVNLFEIDVTTCTKLELADFFKKCARATEKYPQGEEYGRYADKVDAHVQFSCELVDGESFPIKWFYIKHPKFVISHDMAFDTVILSKVFGEDNEHVIPLGKFFRKRLRSRWAYAKNRRDAYKCISNMILSF